MAITYLLIPLVFQRQVTFPKLAKWQPYVFGLGVAGISLFMMGAGTLGVSRRHWDITFTAASFDYSYPPTALLMMALNGLSAIAAALGGLIYIVIVVASVFFGKAVRDKITLAAPSGQPISGAVASYGSAGTMRIPGTLVLVGVFFIAFVLYYFVNWKYLSEIWPMR
jgi:cytochrome c oxidase subunit 1